MPYKTFHNWLFDGSKNSPIPEATEKVDLLKYNSPITNTYLIKIFLKNGSLNHYLNTYFNNIGLRYMEKEDLFKFIKKCVLDFRVRRKDIIYFPYKRKTKLFEVLREKVPEFKNNDISLLCKLIDVSKEKDMIYQSLNIDKPKKIKLGKKKIKKGKVSLDKFLNENFSMLSIK
jgi:hypothetical protein